MPFTFALRRVPLHASLLTTFADRAFDRTGAASTCMLHAERAAAPAPALGCSSSWLLQLWLSTGHDDTARRQQMVGPMGRGRDEGDDTLSAYPTAIAWRWPRLQRRPRRRRWRQMRLSSIRVSGGLLNKCLISSGCCRETRCVCITIVVIAQSLVSLNDQVIKTTVCLESPAISWVAV